MLLPKVANLTETSSVDQKNFNSSTLENYDNTRVKTEMSNQHPSARVNNNASTPHKLMRQEESSSRLSRLNEDGSQTKSVFMKMAGTDILL